MFELLSRHINVHAPHTCNDVHREDNGADDGELAQDIGVLLGALVHADVDLGNVVAVSSAEEARGCVSKEMRIASYGRTHFS